MNLTCTANWSVGANFYPPQAGLCQLKESESLAGPSPKRYACLVIVTTVFHGASGIDIALQNQEQPISGLAKQPLAQNRTSGIIFRFEF